MSGRGGIRDFDVSIGDLSEQLGLTPRAIRFYEEKGLIRSSRDQFNWRRYGIEARRKLALIVALRSADMPISEIRAVMQTTGNCADAQRRAVASSLERRLASLDAERAMLLGQLERIRSAAVKRASYGRSERRLERAAVLKGTS